MPTTEQAAEWADALESGRWEQCRVMLYANDQRCCLGVASEVFGLKSYGTLQYPEEVMSDHDIWFFTGLNDKFRYDFHEIARIVRQRYQVSAE